MVRRYNRLLVAFHVVSDALLGMAAFVLAYLIRFESGLIPVTKGLPAVRAVRQRPAVHRVLVPLAFHLQGSTGCGAAARASTTSSPLVGSILAVVLGVVGTLYFQAYYLSRTR
jgi:hypothetical protein